MSVLHNNANRDFMHLIWKIYYYELVTGMEKDILVSHKGQGTATNREIGQGVTRIRAGAAPCKNGVWNKRMADCLWCSEICSGK
jgi:hypothetical protein